MATYQYGPRRTLPAEPEASVRELVQQLSEQTSRLARQEVELAKAELEVKGRRAGVGAGLFGGAGVSGLYALGALVAAAVLALATAVAAWLAALIVAAALAVLTGVLVVRGRSNLQSSAPPVPDRVSDSVKKDLQWAKGRTQAAGR
jgi:hypothetical protein